MADLSLGQKAAKVDPQYTVGELVLVATGRNQSEAEMIAGLLLEEGIPSLIKRTRGFDVPDMLAAGPRDIFVAESARGLVREILRDSELAGESEPYRPAPLKLFAGLLLAVVAVAVVVSLGVLVWA
ncbi:MAG: hypothetical protein F2813_04120 [Actinobacteria bacterium]|uniref:Unannotated protein n=1 Tax=freshwater metagenome TaxID=449393 RepID=A0A6J5ZWC0_9ZZZZ|nr:hypothetical protein [Actinomycetota bacterium]